MRKIIKEFYQKGEKLNIVIAKKLKEKGLQSISVSNVEIIGKYLAKDIKNKNGEDLVKAGYDITEEQLEKIINQEEKTLQIVNIDPINKGYIFLKLLKLIKILTNPRH